MKKIIMACLVFVIALGVTGCGDKKLVCTGTQNGSDVEITTSFKKKEVSEMIVKMSVETSSEAEAQSSKTIMDTSMNATLSSRSGVTYHSEIEGKKIIMTVTLDTSLADEETRKNITSSGENTYDGVKADLERQGFICE